MKTAIIIILLVAVIITLVVLWLGGFKKVHVGLETQGGEILVYETLKGDYRQSAGVMDRIYYRLLNENGIETTKGFGIYYDNPQKVKKENLRSEAGCIVETRDLGKLNDAGDKYRFKIFPEAEYIVASFPYRNKLSIFFSLMKVYPALNTFAEKHNYPVDGPVMEIYDIPNKKILYRKQISK